jgi:pimeloyl-ACP methyl ester carboxylesterase
MTRTTFQSFDGASLSYRIEGAGRPVLMLHGFLANSRFNWIEPGITRAIVDAGFQAIMLDHRGRMMRAPIRPMCWRWMRRR